MKLLYDIHVADENDEYIIKVERAVQGASEGVSPGVFLVEVLPFLRYVPQWLPGAEFQARFAGWRAAAADLKNAPVVHVRDAMVSCLIYGSWLTLNTRLSRSAKKMHIA